MVVHHVESESEFYSQVRRKDGRLVVVDFSATWCGPCKMIKPVYERLSDQYTDVVFVEVLQDKLQEVVLAENVRAFPTFKFYIDGNVMEEVRGANPQLLESTISRLRPEVASFSGSGNTLGGGGAPADARAAFLSRFEQAGEGDNSRDEDMEGSGEPSGAPPVVNQELLSQMKELGFPENRCVKALYASGNETLEAAIEWLTQHQNDPDIDAPLLLSEAEEKENSSLTLEEKVARAQALLEERRKQREQKEKEDARLREIKRREEGKARVEAREELERLQRQRDMEAKKREKQRQKEEREAVRRKLEEFKREKMAHHTLVGTGGETLTPEHPTSNVATTPEGKIQALVKAISAFKSGGRGLTALKTLRIYLKNIVEKDDPKFRTINMENKAFQERIANTVGAQALLEEVGFAPHADEANLVFEGANLDLAAFALKEVENGIATL